MEKLLEKLEMIDVWSWKEKYVKDGVCDGTQWSIELELHGKKLISSGDNAYPLRFKLFCKAIAKLAGGRAFE